MKESIYSFPINVNHHFTVSSPAIKSQWVIFQLLFFITMLIASPNAFSQITFLESIGSFGFETGLDGKATSNGEYLLAGSVTNSVTLGEGWVLRLNAIGDTMWTITTGGPSNEAFYSIVPTSDGGCVAGGYSASFGAGNTEYYAVKLDASGNILWANVYGSSSNSEEAYKIIETGGGFLLAGFGGPFSNSYPIYLINLDVNGSVIWSRSIGGDNIEGIKSVVQTANGGYAIVGSDYAEFESHILLLKVDNLGKVEWAKKYAGEIMNDVAQAIVQSADGGFAIAGYSSNWGTNTDMFLIKTDGEGNLSWAKNYGTQYADYCIDLEQTSDGGFILAGYNEVSGLIVKTNAIGDTLWSRYVSAPGAPNVQLNSVSIAQDNGYLLTGSMDDGNSYDLFVAKTNSNGFVFDVDDPYDTLMSTCPVTAIKISTGSISPAVSSLSYSDTTEAPFTSGASSTTGHAGSPTYYCLSVVGIEDFPKNEGSLSVYPNPANEKVNLQFNSIQNSIVRFEFLTAAGKIIFEKTLDVRQASSEIEINTSGFENGIYLVIIRTDSEILSGKLAIVR